MNFLLFVAQEIFGHFLDVFGPGGGPHKELAIGAHVSNDLADLRAQIPCRAIRSASSRTRKVVRFSLT